MSDKVYPVPPEWAKRAHVNAKSYQEMYDRSIKDPEGFWAEAGQQLQWIKPYTRAKNTTFGPGNVDIRWFEGGTLNVTANCIDRHLPERADQVAIIW
jgi:acetyl-CoA synthetase